MRDSAEMPGLLDERGRSCQNRGMDPFILRTKAMDIETYHPSIVRCTGGMNLQHVLFWELLCGCLAADRRQVVKIRGYRGSFLHTDADWFVVAYESM
ncbi:hypothetical protein [Pasteuria penetrans]|uniref:hypothetical protein n=1 Tax=Pasteuria penetrans TaxID=86005 RepID=UPI0011EE312B|nr:hypothetical protein [Pasteuria penetrans]